ncbi:MAG TPA: MBL fold metallo-hydrolase [bacterium]|jgi:L-ascorbate metabolism protein UlaG (beta-lactamase superfamily)|nr:MBL fold metallo-hydrolase [bacterium]
MSPTDQPLFPWLHWLHHASFRIESQGKVIYIDPYRLKNAVPADLILVTHDHSDHFSPKDIQKIAKPGSILVGPARVTAKAAGVQVLSVAPGENFEAAGIRGRAVASYNLRKPMHPKSHGNTGFILELPEGRVYHAGDTDFIEEMAAFQGLKLALLPVGKVLFFHPTMGPEQAARAVEAMAPEYAVPMHFGTMPASKGDGLAFKKAVGERALILPQEEPV